MTVTGKTKKPVSTDVLRVIAIYLMVGISCYLLFVLVPYSLNRLDVIGERASVDLQLVVKESIEQRLDLAKMLHEDHQITQRMLGHLINEFETFEHRQGPDAATKERE